MKVQNLLLLQTKKIKDFSSNFLDNHLFGLLITIILSMLYVLPIVFANVNYIDDMGRAVEGYGLNGPGRFVATILMKVGISLNPSYAFNLFPFSQLMSASLYGVSGYLICLLFGIDKGRKIKLGALLIVLSPFLLENLAYRYDCITMSLSVFLIILPYFFKDSFWKFVLISVSAIYLSLGLYQGGSTCYIFLGIHFLVQILLRGDYLRAIKFGATFFGAFVIAIIVYNLSLTIMHIEISSQGKPISLNAEGFSILESNLLGYFGLIDSLFNSSNYRYILFLFILFSIVGFVLKLKNSENSNSNKIISGFLILLLLLGSIFLIPGFNLLVQSPNWNPRVMMGFPFLLLIFYNFLNEIKGATNLFGRFSVFLLIYSSFLFCSQFGIALKNQDQFSDYIIELASPELVKRDDVNIAFEGTIPFAPQNMLIIQEFPLIRRLVIRYESGSWIWGLRRFNKFGLTSGDYHFEIKEEEKCKLPIVSKNKFFDLRMFDSVALIDFTKSVCSE